MRIHSILLSFFVTACALAQTIEIVPPAALDAGNTGTWKVIVSNPGMEPTRPREVRLDFTPFEPLDGEVVSVPPGCHVADNGRQTACVPTVLEPGESEVYEYRFRLTGPYGAVFTYATYGYGIGESYVPDVSTTNLVELRRPFPVTNTNDSGPGSLRQAILEMNAVCNTDVVCDVLFHVEGPVPVEGWFTIRPLTPLPRVTARSFHLDGGTQTAYTGDTNPAGPELMLDGSLVTEWGHGLQLEGGVFATVTDLAIGNFGGNGIASTGLWETRIERCHLGMNPSGTLRAPNGLRGAQLVGGTIVVTDSLLGGNFRSGGWFETSTFLDVSRNRFVDNGASGFYVKLVPVLSNHGGASYNYIARNAHAGISVDRLSAGRFAANDFEDNLGRAIDIGIDGPTLAMVPGLPGFGGIVGAPVITSARYDNGDTILEASLAPLTPHPHLDDLIYFYASPHYKDGGELLGYAMRTGSTFTLRVPRDLRGQWVSAATFGMYVYGWDSVTTATSEVGELRLVE
ncbi:MAG TPA: right-handed parallel beta-helix repeat-containing protein [Thermoanaerobaculia bacterium]|jgi:hypothetical protein